MKTVFRVGNCVSLSQVFLFFLCIITSTSKAQTYYSNFSSPSGHYSTSSPSGDILCLAPSISDASNIAGDLDEYARITGLLSVTLLCSDQVYSFRSKINFAPSSLTAAPANSYAGYMVQFNSVVTLALLQDNIQLITYKEGVPQDTSTNSNLLGLDLLSTGTPINIAFQTEKEFDEVEMLFNTAVLPIGLAFDYHFFFAFATSNPIVLPLKLTSFTGVVEGKNNRLQWSSTSDESISKYEVEKRNNQGGFSMIGKIESKGSSTKVDYNFTDKAVVSEEELYRLKITDRNGVTEYSKAIFINNKIAPQWKVYPTLLSSGSGITVNLSSINVDKVQLLLANLQGQTVRNVSTADGKVIIPTSGLSSGIYILKLLRNGQLQTQEKIVIQ